MISFDRRLALATALAVAAAAVPESAVIARDASDAAVTGRVVNAGGAPIPGAAIALRGTAGERSARTDRDGRFTIAHVAPGSYAIRAFAAGYGELVDRTIGIGAGPEAITLTLSQSSSSLLTTIGRVQTNAGDAISTSTAPSTTIDSQAYAAAGYTRVSDVLQDDVSTTLVRPLGGSSLLPTPVALRGPDPTETLVDVDGHQINNGNTGDFDLSLLDPADYSTIELVKGISPSSLVGPDTIDGAINIRTLEPTGEPHGLARLTGGSYDSFAETLQSTGTVDRFGYALSLRRTTSAGEVNRSIYDTTAMTNAAVGSAFDGSTALGKLRYAFGSAGDRYAEFTFHDQSQFRDLSAALSSFGTPGADASDAPVLAQQFAGFEGTALQAHNAGYGLDLRTPLGGAGANGVAATSALYRHYSSLVSESVTGPGAQTSPYLYDERDLIGDDSLEFDHTFAHASLALQLDVRNETLTTDFVSGVVNDEALVRRRESDGSRRGGLDDDAASGPASSVIGLGQTQRSGVLRYTYDPTSQVHLTAATYYSDYSVFGHSLDPRFGFTFDPDARSVVRFSLGTTFQAPQLPELYVPPTQPAAVGGYVSVGNPNLQPDHATEYDLGAEHVFETGARRTDLSVDVYRVNLRAPASLYLPNLDPTCGATTIGGDGTACPLSYPVNAGDGIYQGIEIAGARRIAPFTTVRAGYAVRSAFLTKVPAAIQDGTLVVGEQTLGLPLQKYTLSLRAAPPLGFGYDVGLVYEGLYNELNQPQFAVLDGGLAYRWRAYEIDVDATILTNVYDQHFTHTGAGLTYGGLAGPIATDAYALQGTAINASFARRF